MRRLPLLALVVVLVACGGHGSAARTSVADYIARVDAVEQGSQDSLLQVRRAVSDFSRRRDRAEVAKELASARRALVRLHTRLVRTTAPPQARKLARLVRALVAEQASLVDELRRLAVFDPRLVSTLRPLARANAAARMKLAAAPKDPAVAAAAIGDYRAAIEQALPRLRRLDPPAVERPLYRAQVTRLEALDRSLGRLRAAIEAKDATAIARADHAVSVASVSADSRANQLAQRAAVASYNARVARLRTLEQQILDERNRLQIKLR